MPVTALVKVPVPVRLVDTVIVPLLVTVPFDVKVGIVTVFVAAITNVPPEFTVTDPEIVQVPVVV